MLPHDHAPFAVTQPTVVDLASAAVGAESRINIVGIIAVAVAVAALGSTAIAPFGVDVRRGALTLLATLLGASLAGINPFGGRGLYAGARIIPLALISRAPR